MPVAVIEDSGLGRIEVRTLRLPEWALQSQAAYSATGTVLVDFKTTEHPEADWLNLGVVNDDGSDFRVVFSGPAPLHPKGNGRRLLPFADGRRVLLGDHILELDPGVDDAGQATLVPLVFPDVVENDPAVMHRWSESCVAPDNEHIAWTTLHHSLGAYNGLGRVRRDADRYVIDDARRIDNADGVEPDPDRPGWLRLTAVRGGEVKQFVRGGTALSLAGSAGRPLIDSVLQDLTGPSVTALTLTPGYDETTILSLDESLGVVMTTRFSPDTNCAVFGLLPRPLGALIGAALAMPVYLYSVAGVRESRNGNVGPALVDLGSAQTDDSYLGADLSDPSRQWVYLSPMSWHPDSRRTMWNERLRGQPDHRVRIATLLDRTPSVPIRALATPDVTSYSRPLTKGCLTAPRSLSGRIPGPAGGSAELHRSGGGLGQATTIDVVYHDYTPDGRTFWNGTEQVETRAGTAATTYTADVCKTGDDPGEMMLRATFAQNGGLTGPVHLDFGRAQDGQPTTFGHASYRGVTLQVSGLIA